MTPDGVMIPLTLSHRMLSQLVGARRPTVSTALAELAREKELRRLENGTWLLTGKPAGAPAGDLRLVPPRRRFLPADAEDEPDERLTAVPAAQVPAGTVRLPVDGGEIRERLGRLREDCREMTTELQSLYVTTNELTRRTKELRARRDRSRAAMAAERVGRVRRPA
jgi:hypothetical protein